MPEIAIYEDIDSATGYGPQKLRDSLAVAAGQPVTIRLNSEGGNVIDGLACYNILKQYPAKKTIIIDGMALSIASVLAMAGDEIKIAENAWLMIHNPNNQATGDGDSMREMATLLDAMRDQLANVYAAKSGKTPDECRALMAAETWLAGPKAVEAGFADTLTAPLAVAATFDSRRFTNPPKTKELSMAAATYAELKKALPRAKAEIIVRCLDRNLDIDAARAEFDEDRAKTMAEMTEELTKCKAELEEMKTAEAKAKAEEAMTVEEEKKEEVAAKAKAEEEEKQAAAAKARGVKPAKTTAKAKSGQSATARWNDAVAERIRAGLPRAKAVRAVAIDDPDLQAEFIAEANAA